MFDFIIIKQLGIFSKKVRQYRKLLKVSKVAFFISIIDLTTLPAEKAPLDFIFPFNHRYFKASRNKLRVNVLIFIIQILYLIQNRTLKITLAI